MKQIRNSCRGTLMILGFLGFAVLYSLRVNLSIAIIAMVKHSHRRLDMDQYILEGTCPVSNFKNESTKLQNTSEVNPGEFTWDEKTQGQILGSFFYGYVMTNLLGGRLADKFGGRRVFGCGVILTAILAILSPSAARISKNSFIAVRLLQGMTEGVTFPSINSMMASWVPSTERSYFVARIYGGVQFGTFITMMFSGVLAQSRFGWPSIFISTGVLGIIWGYAWFYCTSDTPATHPWITEEEKLYLVSTAGKTNLTTNMVVPWTKIGTSLPFLAVVIAHFGSNWGFYCLLTELPSYLSSVHHLRIEDIGLYVSISYLLMLYVMMSSSSRIDYWISSDKLSVGSARKLGTAIGEFGPMIMLLFISSAGCNFIVVIILLWLAVAISGAHVCGYTCGFQELAPNFAGTITGLSNTIASIPGILAPQVTGIITNNESTIGQWNKVFVLAAVIYFISASFYLTFMSEKVQPWNKETYHIDRHSKSEAQREVKHI